MSTLTATVALTWGPRGPTLLAIHPARLYEFAALNCFDQGILGTVCADLECYQPRTADRRRPLWAKARPRFGRPTWVACGRAGRDENGPVASENTWLIAAKAAIGVKQRRGCLFDVVRAIPSYGYQTCRA